MFYEKIDYDKIPELAKKMETFFCYNANTQKTSYLNWRVNRGDVHSFVAIAEGYAESAIQLIDMCLTDNSDKKADAWIFPILHCIIHSIELNLKTINFLLAILLDEQPKIEGQHKIQQICSTALTKLRRIKKQNFFDGCVEMITAIQVVKNFIDNIYQKTDDMSFARYPITHDKKDMFYMSNNENVVVDLEKLKEQYSYVYMMMDAVIDSIYRNLEFLSDISES